MYKFKVNLPPNRFTNSEIISILSNLDLDSTYLRVENKNLSRKCKSQVITLPKELYLRIRSKFQYLKVPLERVLERLLVNKVDEKYYQQVLLKKDDGWTREVKTPVGYIDGLNIKEKRIIELKFFKGWKGALGQIMCYNYYYNFSPEIWLLGGDNDIDYHNRVILPICNSYGVKSILFNYL